VLRFGGRCGNLDGLILQGLLLLDLEGVLLGFGTSAYGIRLEGTLKLEVPGRSLFSL
jgi:hypothetical protein